MEQQLEQFWQEWQTQRKEMIALIRRIDKSFEQHGKISNVASVFLKTIEQSINSGQASITRRENGWPSNADERFVGWYDNGGIYLLPSNARMLVARTLGVHSDFCRTSEIIFHKQLYGIGVLVTTEGRLTKKVRISKKVYNLLHVKPGFISLAST